jgi:DNA-binding response OmpR family regulator
MTQQKQALVVTADRTLGQELSAVLKGIGYSVTSTRETSETRQILGNRQYEIAFIGAPLPEMSWRSTLNALKSKSMTTRLVMVTRQVDESDMRSGLTGGAYFVLDRPVSEGKIADILSLPRDGQLVVFRD